MSVGRKKKKKKKKEEEEKKKKKMGRWGVKRMRKFVI